MNPKSRRILSVAVCGIMGSFSPALRAQTPAPSISQAPEVGQGTSTSNISLGGSGTQYTPGTSGTSGKQEHGHGKKMGKLADELGLTPQQKASLMPILKQRHAEMKALRKESLPEVQKKSRMKALRKASNQQIKGILTPEQDKKLVEILKERHKQSPKQS